MAVASFIPRSFGAFVTAEQFRGQLCWMVQDEPVASLYKSFMLLKVGKICVYCVVTNLS